MRHSTSITEVLLNTDGISKLVPSTPPAAVNKLQRCIWLTAIVLSSIGCFVAVSFSVSDFFAYDVLTNLQTVQSSELKFPVFIICAWDTDLDIENRIIFCEFNHQSCLKEFERTVIIGYGQTPQRLCLKLNENKRFITKKISFDFGLVISLKVPKDLELFYGLYENSRVISSDMTNTVYPGEAKYITIKKFAYNKLGKPFNECQDNPGPIADSQYRQVYCFRLCMLNYIEEKCECSLSAQYMFNGSDTCNNPCFENEYKQFDFVTRCGGFCPLECDSVSYDLMVHSRVPKKTDFKMHLENWLNSSKLNETMDSIAEEFVGFKINFEGLSYTALTETPKMTVTNLIAELGGMIGNNSNHFIFI